MSWNKTAALLREHLGRHCAAFGPADGLKHLPWFRALHTREEHYRGQVDVLCQEFIFSGLWPKMNKLQAHLVSYRLAWGIKLALGMETPFLASHSATVSFPDVSEAQILHWLLIDTWNIAPKEAVFLEAVKDPEGLVDAALGELHLRRT